MAAPLPPNKIIIVGPSSGPDLNEENMFSKV